jgi:hypothetical protein
MGEDHPDIAGRNSRHLDCSRPFLGPLNDHFAARYLGPRWISGRRTSVPYFIAATVDSAATYPGGPLPGQPKQPVAGDPQWR